MILRQQPPAMAAVLFVELPSANMEPPRETAAAFLFSFGA
jgi:hypothetical protein